MRHPIHETNTWYTLETNTWYTLETNTWYTLETNTWYTLETNTWYTLATNTSYTLATQTWDMSSANFAYTKTWEMDFAQRHMVDRQEKAFHMPHDVVGATPCHVPHQVMRHTMSCATPCVLPCFLVFMCEPCGAPTQALWCKDKYCGERTRRLVVKGQGASRGRPGASQRSPRRWACAYLFLSVCAAAKGFVAARCPEPLRVRARGTSGAAARHSQHDRAHTEFFAKKHFFPD